MEKLCFFVARVFVNSRGLRLDIADGFGKNGRRGYRVLDWGAEEEGMYFELTASLVREFLLLAEGCVAILQFCVG